MMTPAARRTKEWVKATLLAPALEGRYQARWEHTLRVAEVGLTIAREEGLDGEALYLACLLHDVGYVRCKTPEDYDNHGAICARMAEEFLRSIGYDGEKAAAICYGILIHTLQEQDYPRPATAFELSVGDADNIDRFDAFRFTLRLQDHDLEAQTPQEIMTLCAQRIARIEGYRRLPLGIAAVQRLWRECLDMHLHFYRRLQRQMEVTLEAMEQSAQ